MPAIDFFIINKRFKKLLTSFFIFLLLVLKVEAQSNSDSAYAMPLKEVLAEVQQRYSITLRFDSSLIDGKILPYARWRYRADVEETLKNILAPFDLMARRDGTKRYKIGNYEYYRWQPQDGWAELDRIAAHYNNLEEWQHRKEKLKSCLLHALRLSKLPTYPLSKPIETPVRKYRGYTVSNIAIEILKGVWINGSIYRPDKIKGKVPVILNPDGHWQDHRFRADCQLRCAAFAKMGAIAISYDLFGWGESELQFKYEDHRKALAQTIQILGAIRILDYLLSLKEADTSRVAITGGSGGGSHTILMTAIDDRIKVSAPVVSVSSYFYGGCPCESGMPIHLCEGGTNNVEIAAMAAPRPQLLISDGADWTDKMPEHDFPYLQKIYQWYDRKDHVENVHFPEGKHDFNIEKREAVYRFMAKHLGLNMNAILDRNGNIDESDITIEKKTDMYVFGEKGERLPAHAMMGFDNLRKVFEEAIK